MIVSEKFDDNFGYTGLAVASPILLVLLYAVFSKFANGVTIAPIKQGLGQANALTSDLLSLLPNTMWTVFLSILPLAILLLVFQQKFKLNL